MTSSPEPATKLAAARVVAVRDDPAGRVRLMEELYEGNVRSAHLPFRRATMAFMRWQLRRGLLAPADAPRPGSLWWRAVNEALLSDIAESRELSAGAPGVPSRPAVQAVLDFIDQPTANRWYRAHNLSIAGAYLANRELAAGEGRVERFFLNVVLLRVIYAHALVAAPRLALGWLSPVGSLVGDPRLGTTGIFLSLSRVLPDRYPLGEDVMPHLAAENGFGRILDTGVIGPRLRPLYDWSARELELPDLAGLLVDDVPAYAWDPADRAEWTEPLSQPARLARRFLPLQGSWSP